MELASSGENGSKFWSCVPAPCCELSDVNLFSLHSCEKIVFAIVTLTPSYSHFVPMAGSTGSKSEIAKFRMIRMVYFLILEDEVFSLVIISTKANNILKVEL